MPKLAAIYGASGFGREVLPQARAELAPRGYELVFVDDGDVGTVINGLRVLKWQAFLDAQADDKLVSLAIANSRIREEINAKCTAAGIGFFEIRAGNVVAMDEVTIGEGAILCPFVTLTSNIRIGRHFHCNLYSYVAHDCVIGDFVTFAPAVKCNGNVVVEDHAYIGTGAVLRQGIPGKPLVIGRGAVVGMGAVVTKDVPPGVTVVGNPARPMEPK